MGIGEGRVVGMRTAWVGRTSRSVASEMMRVWVDLLNLPSAKMRLPTNFARLILVGISSVMAWESEVAR